MLGKQFSPVDVKTCVWKIRNSWAEFGMNVEQSGMLENIDYCILKCKMDGSESVAGRD